MATTDSSLLDPEADALYQQLLLQAAEEQGFGQAQQPQTQSVTVIPKPGFCVKTKNDKNEKIFINVCTSDNVPRAKEISDQELLDLLDSDDPTGYRIPMSLGEPHAELDKSGQGCTAYDVVVNPDFYKHMLESKIMEGFFLTVTFEGLEHKYNITIDRAWKKMKNRKFVGSLPEQHIRTKSKPLILEMNNDGQQAPGGTTGSKSLISEISSAPASKQDPPRPKAPEPPYTILQEPPDGYPDFLVAEIHLPKVKSSASVTLDLGEDRILLQTRSNVYYLDIYLPYDMVPEECGAQFNRKTQILTITMPVKPS